MCSIKHTGYALHGFDVKHRIQASQILCQRGDNYDCVNAKIEAYKKSRVYLIFPRMRNFGLLGISYRSEACLYFECLHTD
ncbi:hypothetical protein P8452_66493 [Trifolium repens]|nr:hypothetical protein P8452_66493 [Trifolium repens]